MPRRKGESPFPIEQEILDAAFRLHVTGSDKFYGYRIGQELAGDRPMSAPGFGTLYRALARLEARGWLASEWEDEDSSHKGARRHLYWLTPAGRAVRVANVEGQRRIGTLVPGLEPA